jgi:hypothetical protein
MPAEPISYQKFVFKRFRSSSKAEWNGHCYIVYLSGSEWLAKLEALPSARAPRSAFAGPFRTREAGEYWCVEHSATAW